VSDQKDNTHDTSENTKFAKHPIVETLPKVGKTNSLSNPVTSNSISIPQESKGVNNDKVIALGMFRINPSKSSREEKHVPNTVSASARTKPITVSQPHVITKKDVNYDLNGLSSTGVDNTKTKRPQPRSIQRMIGSPLRLRVVKEVKSNVVCAMCSKCLISVNHDKCLCKLFNQEGKIVDSSKSKSKSACSNGDNACTSNTMEPKIKRFPNSTSLLDRLFRFVYGVSIRVVQAYDRKSKASHQFHLEVYGNCPLWE
nr:hypothetical protein [Tanacetum cinerariifolium]